ncbi:kinesin-like protein KIF21A [Watersipora subatra]|uniref:kinesin-like protein KIF21A n=1 Tax=Watersipora subatra TaxID=2589382 RepID=UPI00355C3A3A
MLNLQDQIMAVERERDQVLSSLGSKKQQSEERVRKVKMDFEKRLDTMQQELNKVNTAKKEHAKMMKNQVVYDRRIRDLSTELNEMKKIKVRLMAQMKTESEKNKISDQRKNKELLQLKKEKRRDKSQLTTSEIKDVRLTPPSSPSLSRRRQPLQDSDSTNVFMRLTNTQTGGTQIKRRRALALSAAVTNSNQSLICVKKTVGHTKAVLSICAADNLLVSGSKDLTCKVWDMSIGSEVLCLGGHPNYVSKVRYCEVNWLVYTVSNSFVKISSGLVHDSIPVEPASSSQAILQQGEQQIFDIQVSRDGHKLYTTTGTIVRLWDLNTHKSAALLFSPKVAKSKWDKLERYITSVVVRKQTIANMEAEMDLHISKREQLSKKIDAYSKRLDTAIRRNEVTSSNQSLICVKKAVGHTKAVLSICAADNLLVSGSKDLTCKVWDMSIGSEVLCLGGHPNYVSKVQYCEVNRLAYTVSNSFVKMWDIRAGAKCITVLRGLSPWTEKISWS